MEILDAELSDTASHETSQQRHEAGMAEKRELTQVTNAEKGPREHEACSLNSESPDLTATYGENGDTGEMFLNVIDFSSRMASVACSNDEISSRSLNF